MKKRIMALIMAMSIMTGSGLTAYAAPVRMADGTIFDAEYYAQNNLDVVAALGTDADVLYQHYQNYGRAEGRKAYDENSTQEITDVVAPVFVQNIEPAGDYNVGSVYGPKLTKQELEEVKAVVKVFLASYDFSTMDDYGKFEACYNYLYDTCEFAPDWRLNKANTAWGALVYHQAQCSGYARAFKALCDAVGLGCYYVHADQYSANPSHQWNVVSIDGGWYIVDVEANDRNDFRVAYLSSDDTYVGLTGMSWDRSSVPACPECYGLFDLEKLTRMNAHGDSQGRIWYLMTDGRWMYYE